MVSLNEITTLLSNFSIFNSLEESELKEISTYFTYKKIPKNDHIFYQGEKLHSIFFLYEGRVKIYKNNNQGKEQLVTVYNNGEMFPHIGNFFEKQEYPANALVIEDSSLLFVPNHRLEELLTKQPKISIILLKVMGEKLTELQCRLEEKLLNTTYEQVIKLLLRLSNKHGVKLSNGNVLFLTPFQNKELASIIGASRETVSRIMTKLETKKMIERDHKGRLILKVDLLRDEI